MIAAITFMAIFLVFYLLRRLLPYRASMEYDRIPISELRRKYAKTSVLMLFLNLLTWPLCGTLWYYLFQVIVNAKINSLHGSVFLLYETTGLWVVLSLFLGMISSVTILFWALKLILKHNYGEYLIFYNMCYGFDALKALRGISILVCIVTLTASTLGLNWYTQFTESELVVNSLWSFREVKYTYSRIVEISYMANRKAPNGNIVDNPHFKIRFDDEYTWSSNLYGPENCQNASIEEILIFLSEKSNIPITKSR